ncbi:MAG: hypothetical protein IPN33_11300 [Saprospiraceae bacterium]|nr:hypothetical protein [Saprospiraceae bacterium]
MTKQEVKSQIEQILESLPADHLEEVLAYLRILEKVSVSNVKRSSALIQIMREDREVLQKLAQ